MSRRPEPDVGVRAGVAGAVAVLAALLALVPVFADLSWLPASVAAVVVVTGCGLLARWMRLWWAGPVLAAASLLVLGTVLAAPQTAVLGLVPTPGSVDALLAVARSGLADVRELAVPVPSTTGLALLAAAGAGLVALAVDLVAATARRPALAGVPLLGLVVVALAVLPDGLPLWSFLLTAGAFLALLLVDDLDRVQRWGSLVPSRGDGGRSSRAAVGRRIGAVALGLGVVVPLLLPAASTGAFGIDNGWGFGLGSESRSIVTYNPIVKLKDQLTQPTPTDLLRVETAEEQLGYLRMTVLDVYDGGTWGQSELRAGRDQRVSGDLPPPPGLEPGVPTRAVSTEVTALALDVPWLPNVPRVAEVDVDGDWRYDALTRTIFSTHVTTQGRSWRTTSVEVEPDPERLRAAVPDPAAGLDPERYAALTALPADFSPQVRALAAQVVEDAGATTPFDRTVALQEFLRGPDFSYSLEADSGTGADRLAGFLLEGRQGYCEQFAAGFAVMARSLGLPSRVAIGFLPGGRGPDGAWTITTDQAHAWPEVWFDGVGWLAFEPTPAASGSVPPSYAPAVPEGTAAGAQADGDGATAPAPETSAPAAPAPAAPGARAAEGLQGDLAPVPAGDAVGDDGGPSVPLLPVLAVAALLALPALLRVGTRAARLRRRPGGVPVGAAWAEVLDTAVDLRVPVGRAATPRSAARTLVDTTGADAGTADALTVLAAAAERAAYARDPGAAPSADTVRAARAGLLAAVPFRARWRARLAPRSTLVRVGSSVGSRWAAVTGTGERMAERVRAQLRERTRRA